MSGVIERATGIRAGARGGGRQLLAPKRVLIGLATALGLAAVAAYGVQYWQVGRFMVETDDALRPGRLDHHCATRPRLHLAGPGQRQPAGQDRAGPGADR